MRNSMQKGIHSHENKMLFVFVLFWQSAHVVTGYISIGKMLLMLPLVVFFFDCFDGATCRD